MEAQPFILFGVHHLITLLTVLMVTILVPFYFKQFSKNIRDGFGYFLAAILICDFLAKPYYWTHFFDYELIEVFPLHMCSLTSFSIAIFLLTKNKIFYEISFFWGIGGGLMALLQPDTKYSFPDIYFIIFYLAHGTMWLAISYSTITLNNRPSLQSLKRVLVISFICLIVIYILNWLLGPPANYWYLGARPDGASIMDFMPEPPKHIPIVVILGLLAFILTYLPYWIYDHLKAKDAG